MKADKPQVSTSAVYERMVKICRARGVLKRIYDSKPAGNINTMNWENKACVRQSKKLGTFFVTGLANTKFQVWVMAAPIEKEILTIFQYKNSILDEDLICASSVSRQGLR